MNMEFRRKLPIPKEIKEMYPINEAFARLREQGKDSRKSRIF